jgi:hypothetical protein
MIRLGALFSLFVVFFTGFLGAQTTSTGTGSTTTTSATSTGSTTMAVYKLSFSPAGESINYRPYQGGYYIAPITGGTGSLILTLTTGGVKRFYTYASFGELFVAVKGEDRKSVLSAAASNTVSTTTFYAIGDANDQMDVESRSAESEVYVAKLLTGYSVSADSERDLPFASSSATDIGVAGASFLRCTLDEGMTKDAIKQQRTLTEQVTEVQTQLTEKGYTNGSATTTGGTGGTGTTGGTSTTAR